MIELLIEMARREGELIAQVVIEDLVALPKAPGTFVEELIPSSTNAQNVNDLGLKDPYASCRDVEVLDRNGYELFWYFYKNRA